MNMHKVLVIGIMFFGLLMAAFSLSAQEYSLQLNGTSQYAICGANASFYFTNQLTVEAWVYPTNFNSAAYMNTIVAKTHWDSSSYGWSFRYGSSSGTLDFNMSGGGSTWIDCIANNALTLNAWQHVAATYNGMAIKLYVNGVLVATKNTTGNIVNSNKKLCIGSIGISGDLRCMAGRIDEVRIWDVARTNEEIADNLFQCDVTDHLLAYYRMTNGSGTILTDNSGHGYNGSLIGSPVWNSDTPYFMPVVSTENPTSIGMFSATANGNVHSLGYPHPVQYGHCWTSDTSNQPTIANSRTQLGTADSTGAYTSEMSGLAPHTLYQVRAYATNRVGNTDRTAYGQSVSFYTRDYLPPMPTAKPASSITTSEFTANWTGSGYYSAAAHGYTGYGFVIDVATDSDFGSMVSAYSNLSCGTHDASSNTLDYAFEVTGLDAGTTYFYRIRTGSIASITPSSTISVTTLARYNVSYNTGNITGVRIYTAETDYGIDPAGPLVFTQGYSGTLMAAKDGYTWSLGEGSDSNVITALSADRAISFVGTYCFVDPAYPGFEYTAEPDVPISAVLASMEGLTVPLPPHDPGDAMVLIFSGTQPSDITISVPAGTWYASAYYDDPAQGGLAWHHAEPYPASYPQSIVFSRLPFGARNNIPTVLGSQDMTLPVELSAFTATAVSADQVELCWVTQSETNLLGFMVFRNTLASLHSAIGISSLIPATNSSQPTTYSLQDEEINSAGSYYYWLQTLELDGSLGYHGPIMVILEQPDAPGPSQAPLQTRLLPSYPNPFNPTTTIHYELNSPEFVDIRIYNTKGQLIATHSQAHFSPGRYSWVFCGVDQHGDPIASGVYLCVMTAGKHSSTLKMVMAK